MENTCCFREYEMDKKQNEMNNWSFCSHAATRIAQASQVFKRDPGSEI